MELRSKVVYNSPFGTLTPGDTTEGLNYPEDKKKQMLSDFPNWFEVIKVAAPAAPQAVEEGVKKVTKGK